MEQYANLAREALAKLGGKSGHVEIVWDGVKHWVEVIVNEFGDIVSFHPSGGP